jgi:squalene-hopene/tetraprenyl-beta-curcumene cyclase
VQDENKTYGTARVLMALKALRARGFSVSEELFRSAEEGLLAMQLPCGAWGGSRPDGGQASIEETGLALEALVGGAHVSAVMRGTAWLLGKMKGDAELRPAPIGFYFAKLWYFERLYPLLAAVGALGAVTRFYGSETFELEETGGGPLG